MLLSAGRRVGDIGEWHRPVRCKRERLNSKSGNKRRPQAIHTAEEIRVSELVTTLLYSTEWSGAHFTNASPYSPLFATAITAEMSMCSEEASTAYYLSMLGIICFVGVGALCRAPSRGADPILMSMVDRFAIERPSATMADAITRVVRELFLPDPGDVDAAHDSTTPLEAVADRVTRGFSRVFNYWITGGHPLTLDFRTVDPAIGIAQLAVNAAAALGEFGIDAAEALAREGCGRAFAPDAVEIFLKRGRQLIESTPPTSLWDNVLAAEPGAPLLYRNDAIDAALGAIGAYGDLASEYFSGHSARVACIAEETGRKLGLTEREVVDLRRAAYLHDLGRVTVPRSIWNKKEALNTTDLERIRLHSYATERVLARAGSFPMATALAATAHERLDGGGYHCHRGSGALPLSARVLAAADVTAALGERRAYRAAYDEDEAAKIIQREANEGRLDPRVVDAMSTSYTRTARPQPNVAGLSRRQLEVLRLVARGMTNKEIAASLNISVRTAGHHLEHTFVRIGVTNRAAATLFAFQNGLIA